MSTPSSDPSPPLTYRDAGVDIVAGDAFVQRLRHIAESTHGPGVIPAPNGFAGLFALPGYAHRNDPAREPLLVACTDGVGTKIRIAFATGIHHTVGIDLVAMSVNDCIVTGARPLFFLDYIVTGKLEIEQSLAIVEGIGEGCRQSGCALIGGETAEHPGAHPPGEYDLAGFCVGLVDRADMTDPTRVAPGDAIIGLPSTGLHSNGFSLVLRALDRAGLALDAHVDELGGPLGEALLEPTRIYVPAIMALLDTLAAEGRREAVHAMAHITGGGMPGNLPRVLREGTTAQIDPSTWDVPPVFDLVQRAGTIERDEMRRVFNMGIGYALVVAPDAVDTALHSLAANGVQPRVIGHVRDGSGAARVDYAD